MSWTSQKYLFFGGHLLWVVAAYALVLIVVLAQPVASLAWLGGAHATIEQVILHEEAIEHGHYHHHGALQHHEHRPRAVCDEFEPRGTMHAWTLTQKISEGR
jgi:hypothetical protein